jgi:hypothetical protein
MISRPLYRASGWGCGAAGRRRFAAFFAAFFAVIAPVFAPLLTFFAAFFATFHPRSLRHAL